MGASWSRLDESDLARESCCVREPDARPRLRYGPDVRRRGFETSTRQTAPAVIAGSGDVEALQLVAEGHVRLRQKTTATYRLQSLFAPQVTHSSVDTVGAYSKRSKQEDDRLLDAESLSTNSSAELASLPSRPKNYLNLPSIEPFRAPDLNCGPTLEEGELRRGRGRGRGIGKGGVRRHLHLTRRICIVVPKVSDKVFLVTQNYYRAVKSLLFGTSRCPNPTPLWGRDRLPARLFWSAACQVSRCRRPCYKLSERQC